MTTKKTVVEGKVRENIYGIWDDVDKGLFVGHEKIDSLFCINYFGKHVRVTIEEIEPPKDDQLLDILSTI